ncbi:MAG: hypothetical protein ACTS6J_01945 [Burkholderiales bacterium]
MRAWNLTRADMVYRHNSFSAGLKAAGFDVQKGVPTDVKPDEVVLGWNRYGGIHDIATKTEKAGGIYICAENGYLAEGGLSPHDMSTRTVYALGRGWHNDSTAIREGPGDRWQALGIDLKPWRADGGHVLVCANRSFGAPDRMMPINWADDVAKRLAKLMKREIRIRPHPGNSPPVKPLVDDLAGAWTTVIWSSSAGVHSLIAGVPVICEAPYWICRGATFESFPAVGDMDDFGTALRLSAMQRLAWGQWHLSEIESGYAFNCLLQPARQTEIQACA